MAKMNAKKHETDSREQIARNLLNIGNSEVSEAIKTVLESTDICLAYLDRDFNYIWVNPSYARAVGHDTQQLTGRNHFDLFPNQEHRVFLKKAIETGERCTLRDAQFELPFQPKGVVTYWNIMADPIRGAEDKVSGLTLTLLENTEGKKMEEALKESDERYRAFIDSSPYGIILINTEGTVIEWNKGEERITGIPRSAALGQPLWDIKYQLMPEERRASAFYQRAREKILSSIRKGPDFKSVLEEEIQRSDGSRRTIQSTVFTIQYQGKIQAGGIVRDITKRKQIERALRVKEANYEELANSIQDIFFAFDTDLRYTFWNKASENLTGISAQDAIGKTIFDIFPDTEDTRRAVAVYRDALMTQQNKSFINEYHYEGQHFFFEINVYPSRSGLTIFSRDITERRLHEIELDRLRQEEKELYYKLENELKKRIEFTHALVHELKTPLTPIVSSSEMLLRELKENRLLRLVRNLYDGAIALNSRVNELLELAKIEVGMLNLTLQPIDIHMLIRDTVDYMIPQALQNEQFIIVHLPESLPIVTADEGRVRQVLMNLISNALRYTVPKSKITVSARRDADNVIVEVQDNGSGLDQEMQKHLFEPYFRLQNGPDYFTGLGLGLPIAKYIVELHGGHIWVSSEIGMGSTFGFSLPLKRLDSER